MPTLLFDLKSNRFMNKSFFIHHLKVYDNAMVLERRRLPFHKEETTISYSHVSQVNLIKDLFFANLEIINTGGVENILIKFVNKKHGKEAKSLIDSKIHTTHGAYEPKHVEHTQEVRTSEIIDSNALTRYKDLLNQGRISKSEYNNLLKKHLRR